MFTVSERLKHLSCHPTFHNLWNFHNGITRPFVAKALLCCQMKRNLKSKSKIKVPLRKESENCAKTVPFVCQNYATNESGTTATFASPVRARRHSSVPFLCQKPPGGAFYA